MFLKSEKSKLFFKQNETTRCCSTKGYRGFSTKHKELSCKYKLGVSGANGMLAFVPRGVGYTGSGTAELCSIFKDGRPVCLRKCADELVG